MPRVLQLIETGGPGGAEGTLIQLASGLDRRRFPSLVCLRKRGWLSEQLERRGVPCRIIESRGALDLGWVARVARLARRERFQLLHSHLMDTNFYVSLVSLLSGVPQVATEHGDVHHFARRRRAGIKARVTGRVARSVVAVSRYTADVLADRLGLPGGRLEVIYNGINPAPFDGPLDRRALRRSLSLPADSRFALSVGNLYPVKGHEVLLGAFARVARGLPDLQLLVAGRGEQAGTLTAAAERLGLVGRFRLLGHREDIPDLLRAADLFVLPSLSEALPLALLEAMAASLPVLASAVGGIPEVVEDGRTGLLVPPGRVEALAAALQRLASRPGEAAEMGRRGRRLLEERFTSRRMVEAYERLYARCLGEGQPLE